jgi:NAD(P)-dependent dehydrogenase (short-subunit alcohol dehydrogenase family)
MRILVTGAGSGIGRALAERLLAGGHDVLGADRDTAGIPRGVSPIRADLTDPVQIAALVEAAVMLDGLANVAGVPGTAPPQTVLRVNFLGPRRLTEALSPRLQRGAAVVNVASLAGRRPICDDDTAWALQAAPDEEILSWAKDNALDGAGAYDLSKKLLVAWTVATAAARLGDLRMNAVSPGPIETPILEDFRTSMGAGVDIAAAVVGRLGRAEEVAAAAAFLLSPAASWVNGVDLELDGGLLAARAAAAREDHSCVQTRST